MSANLDVVRRNIRARNDGDLEGLLATMSPDGIADYSRSRAPWAGIYEGHEGMRRLWDTVFHDWRDFEQVEEDVEERGDHIAVAGRSTFTGRDGMEVTVRGAGLFVLRDGLIVRYEQHQSFEEARANLPT